MATALAKTSKKSVEPSGSLETHKVLFRKSSSTSVANPVNGSKLIKPRIPRLSHVEMATSEKKRLPSTSNHGSGTTGKVQELSAIEDDEGGGSGETGADQEDCRREQITRESLGSLVCVSGEHIGVLRYFGETHFEKGTWCGVEFSEAKGKNDGCVKGVRYFHCMDKHGIFAPISIVTPVTSKPSTNKSSGPVMKPSQEGNGRPNVLPIKSSKCSVTKLPTAFNQIEDEDTPPGAPNTTPVTEDMPFGGNFGTPAQKRSKKESKRKRDKDSYHRTNANQKKGRLDGGQKHTWQYDDAVASGGDSGSEEVEDNCSRSSPQYSTPNKDQSAQENFDISNLLTVKLKGEILGAGFIQSPMFSPTSTYNEAFGSQIISSTPAERISKAPVSRLERLRLENKVTYGTPKSSRVHDAKETTSADLGLAAFPEFDRVARYTDRDWVQTTRRPAAAPPATTFDLERNPLPEEAVYETGSDKPTSLGRYEEDDESQNDLAADSPASSTGPTNNSAETINLETFPAQRPSSFNLAFQGFSSEESSEQGIFGVSTPELIGGDSASFAQSIPTSCCSSPEVLLEDIDNESSLGLLTPSHLQDCWNSNTNDEDIYQHLRSPSVDDMEEFEEEDKTVDQDLADLATRTPALPPNPFRGRMSNSLQGTLVLNENDGLTTLHQLNYPMHHSLHEGIAQQHPSQGRVRRDRTYTQLPTILNLNNQVTREDDMQTRPQNHTHHVHQSQQQIQHQHAPLSFRGSGSGSGSGYCASDPFTDSDINTESEADHDECCASALTASTGSNIGSSSHVNPNIVQNRGARVIDGALYTSHHQQHNHHGTNGDRNSPTIHSNSQNQPMIHHHQSFVSNGKQESTNSGITGSTTSVTDSAASVGKSMDMISSSISVSVSSNSASACASEMESSGFYSDASERNPSGSSVMSESDHLYGHHQSNHIQRRSSRHLSKSSSDCDDSSVALGSGLKLIPLKPLTQSEDDDSVQILSSSSIYNDDDDEVEGIDDMSSFEMASSLNGTMIAGNDSRLAEQQGSSTSASTLELESSPKKVAIVKTNPPTVEYQPDPSRGRASSSFRSNAVDQQVPNIEDEMMLDDEEDMDVDLFAEYDNPETSEPSNEHFEESLFEKTSESMGEGDLDTSEPSVNGNSSSISARDSHALDISGSNEMDTDQGTDTNLVQHGNLIDISDSSSVDLFSSGAGNLAGGFACYRSQSVNCIASLTSSTSSASTVTAKSCITPGTGGLIPTTSKSPRSSKKGESQATSPSSSSSKNTTQHADSKNALSVSRTNSTANSKDSGKGKGRVSSTSESRHGSNTSIATDVCVGTADGNTSAETIGDISCNSSILAEQSSVVSTTSTNSRASNGITSTTNRRSSRPSTTNEKSSIHSASGGGSTRRSVTTGSIGNRANQSANISTISSSSDLNRTSRSNSSTTSAARSNVYGSTRSLASVGQAPLSSANTSKSSPNPAVKKVHRWDNIMSSIAENKHKTINVKEVKSKVYNSISSAKPAGAGSKSTTVASKSAPASRTVEGSSGNSDKVKVGKSTSRATERGNENDPLVPPAIHRRQHHFSSRSSTVSDSSCDDHQAHRGPPPAKHHRTKKDPSTVNRRQVSDLSSASDYSATTQNQSLSTLNKNKTSSYGTAASNLKNNMTTGGVTRRTQRTTTVSGSTVTNAPAGPNGTKSTNITAATSTASKTQGTKLVDVAVKKKTTGLNKTIATTRGVTTKSKVGSASVPSHQIDNPSTKSHPAVKVLRDRNRLGPVGKNYGPAALDANANESEALLIRGQQNGELDGKTSTKVPGSVEPIIADQTTGSHIITGSKTKSGLHNNRVSSHNQHNTQNSVLVQENSSLKEEVSRLTSVVSDLQEQISRLNISGEGTKKTLEGCLAEADTRSVALSIVAQQFDQERFGVKQRLVQQNAENNELKQQLDGKLAELHQLQLEYEKERERNHEEVRAIFARHELEVDVTVKNCENKLEQMQKRHDETLAELKRSHTDELEKIQEAQRHELEQTLMKHRELLDQHRNQSPHDILHKEVESLNVVVEMRNEEIRVLRKDLMDYKNTLNDLQVAREHAKSLVAKIEDLDAQLEKARTDKRKLQEGYQMLEANHQQVESENKRLVRSNDELKWKIKSLEQASVEH